MLLRHDEELCVWTLFGILSLLPVIYALLVIIYRLTLHPLASYPGPFLAKITDCYLAYHAWKGDRHLEFHRCHEKYGKFVRLGPNLLSVNSATALKTIYGHRANVRKSDFYLAFPANRHTASVHSTINKQTHARKRRVLSHAFSDSAIKSMEGYVVDNIDAACKVLGSTPSKQVTHPFDKNGDDKGWLPARDMALWSDYLTFDIMGDLAFGKSFGMTDKHPENRFVTSLISSAALRHLICGTHLAIHNWHLDKLLFPHIAAARTRYMQYSKAQAMERSKLGEKTDRKDFFFHLLHAKDPDTGLGFSQDELWGESNLLIIAGSDTTSTALAATIFYLTHTERALQRLTKEVRNTFYSLDEVQQGPKLASCTYLRACIDEAMRLSPPVGGGLPRTVLDGGLTVDEQALPAGVDVCVSHYTLHHNAEYFPKPWQYLPERWMPTTELQNDEKVDLDQDLDAAHSAFCPFSVGPRGCIGKGLAYVELSTAIARMLFQYDLRLDPTSDAMEHRLPGHHKGEFATMDTFTSMKTGPWVQVRPVEGIIQ